MTRTNVTDGPKANILLLAAVGAVAGILSGLFGIGGGTIIVPALVLWLGFAQRFAAGTSLAAILPTAIVGGATYAVQGDVDWIATLLLAVGMIVGAQIGAYLLPRTPLGALHWGFIVFMVVVIVSMWIIVPQRDDVIDMSFWLGALLVLTGLITGVLSSLLGVGGGVIVVPILMLLFGASDLIAKGTSLLMMIPGSISGTLGNFRRKNVDLRAAASIGIAGALGVPVGVLIAGWVDPFLGNVLFSVYLVFIVGQLIWRKLRPKKK